MLASTALGTAMPTAAPNQVDLEPQAAAAAEDGASVSPATAGHFPGVAAPDGGEDDDDPTLALTKALATATLETMAAAVEINKAASPDTPAVKKKPSSAGSSRAERHARRRTRLRLVRVPTDYLRAGQDSRDRKCRRELVRRCVGRLFSVHEDRASERGISAMMARLTTTLDESASSGAGGGAAAAPSPEHAGLVDLLERMALSKKQKKH